MPFQNRGQRGCHRAYQKRIHTKGENATAEKAQRGANVRYGTSISPQNPATVLRRRMRREARRVCGARCAAKCEHVAAHPLFLRPPRTRCAQCRNTQMPGWFAVRSAPRPPIVKVCSITFQTETAINIIARLAPAPATTRESTVWRPGVAAIWNRGDGRRKTRRTEIYAVQLGARRSAKRRHTRQMPRTEE